MTFRDYLRQQEFVAFITEAAEVPYLSGEQKPWTATKAEILDMWRKVRPDLPIVMTPMNQDELGSTSSYGEDGVRITGSWGFIAAVVGRLKELLAYENPQTKLRLIFKGVQGDKARPDRQSFVFYVNLEGRGKRRKAII